MNKNATCPICGRPAQEKFEPFCSPRCKDVDLNRWLGGVYAIPGETVSPSAGAAPEEEDGPLGSFRP